MIKFILIVAFSFLTFKESSKNILTLHQEDDVNGAHTSYIKDHISFALENQETYGIPASFTIAQAIYESGGGRSNISRINNNHFGIKSNGSYKRYKNVRQSYKDHASVMMRKYPYLLFSTNGEVWAANISSMGYVKSKKYGRDIISIIRFYKLKKYDANEIKGR